MPQFLTENLLQNHSQLKTIVQKYGGTSVATQGSRQQVCSHIRAAQQRGFRVLVVVSAMGREGAPYATDTLLSLLGNTIVSSRERDLLFSCGEVIAGVVLTAELQSQGCAAVMLTGRQAGIVTNNSFGSAEIVALNTKLIEARLNAEQIVIVAGSQGITPAGEITSLGRGGSDVTACALGVALAAERIEIYTDVQGIMTADPRSVPEAELLPKVTYQECYRLAAAGAKVLHPKAIAIAATRPETSLWVGSTFDASQGTVVC